MGFKRTLGRLVARAARGATHRATTATTMTKLCAVSSSTLTTPRTLWTARTTMPMPPLANRAGVAIGSMQTRSIFIQTQSTPNPSSLMFQPGREVYTEGSKNFSSAREAMVSPLAKRLFAIDGVTNVFFGVDFVTVTKGEDADWETVKPQTFEALMDFFASGAPIIDESALDSSGTSITEDDDEIVAMIKELLETRIRPAVAEDGGDIVFKSFNEESGLVTVQLQGSCDGCPSSSVTLKSGIENMLMHYVPEVKGVVQAGQEDEQMDLLDLADLHRGRR